MNTVVQSVTKHQRANWHIAHDTLVGWVKFHIPLDTALVVSGMSSYIGETGRRFGTRLQGLSWVKDNVSLHKLALQHLNRETNISALSDHQLQANHVSVTGRESVRTISPMAQSHVHLQRRTGLWTTNSSMCTTVFSAQLLLTLPTTGRINTFFCQRSLR